MAGVVTFADPVSPEQHDLLTGLLTATGVRSRLDGWAAQRPALPVQAMLLGFHRFQSVNLAYGQTAGDRVLEEIAHRLRAFCVEELEGDALLARVGGRDFLLASLRPMSRERWQWLAEALATQVARPIMLGGDTIRLSPRTALLRGAPGDGASALLDRLDQALAALQRQAGRRTIWADGSHPARALSAARLEADLLGAIDRNEISILFQPQYDVRTGSLSGAEALARWDHPELGRIGAGTLFAVADRADHVAQLSRHIAARALEQAAQWRGKHGLRLSLNVTALDLAQPDFAERMQQTVAASGFDAGLLTLEITEESLIADFAGAASSLELLAQSGIAIALDDFGSGFANFRYLKLLPLHALKLDRSIVSGIESDHRDLAILRAIIAMARALDLKVIAEGVEHPGQVELLAAEGADTWQGFLGSRPVDPIEFARISRQ